MDALLIEPDGTIVEVSGLNGETISNAVGGFFQIIPVHNFGNLSMYVNEEGKLMGLPFNPYATGIVGPRNLLPGDYIAGNLWISGPVDNEGYETQISDDDAAAIKQFVLARGGKVS